MAKKNNSGSGIVYSTEPGFAERQNSEAEIETLPPAEQILRVRLETKHRAGKAVTVVTGFSGKTEDAEALGKKLKTSCGTGGSVKDGEIIVQGDHREKLLQWLLNNGYKNSKRSG